MNNEPDRSLKVLYINHYGVFGGSQRSILELIRGFPENSVKPYFITPSGNGERYFRDMNIPYTIVPCGLSKFDHTRMGHYRGLRWLILIREIVNALPTLWVFWMFRKKAISFDLIHINEITCILPLVLAKRWYKKPVVLHARAVFHNDQSNWLTASVKKILIRNADRIVPIDETVARSIPISGKLSVVHNSFSIAGGIGNDDDRFSKQLALIPKRRINLGFIGAIHQNKGIMELLEALRLCRGAGLDVSLIIAGNGNEQRHSLFNKSLDLFGLNQDKNFLLGEFIASHGLENFVHPIGFSTSTNSFFEYIDVLCFPSYYNALGRPVFEAAFFCKPSIVALREPLSDTFTDGITGIAVEEKNPEAIFQAILRFYQNESLVRQMGTAACELANNNFNSKKNSEKMLSIYRSLVGS